MPKMACPIFTLAPGFAALRVFDGLSLTAPSGFGSVAFSVAILLSHALAPVTSRRAPTPLDQKRQFGVEPAATMLALIGHLIFRRDFSGTFCGSKPRW